MKVLFIADEPVKALWDFYEKGRLSDIDLIVSCGDLPANYLSFLVTMEPVPVLYVPGNHDDPYQQKPPEGCINIDGRVYVYQGIRFLGLGGSMRYHPDGVNMYTEREMKRKINHLMPSIIFHGGFDVLVTHSPALNHHDGKDLPHRGFKCFLKLIKYYHPRYFVHGHMHLNYGRNPRVSMIGDTTVINAYERYIVEI